MGGTVGQRWGSGGAGEQYWEHWGAQYWGSRGTEGSVVGLRGAREQCWGGAQCPPSALGRKGRGG